MELQDYYKILELTPNADQEEIKQAYRRLARKFHPDVSEEPEAEKRFKHIKEAYEILSDPQIQFVYTQTRKIIKPYSWAWLRSKINAYERDFAQLRAKMNAQERAKAAQLPHKRTTFPPPPSFTRGDVNMSKKKKWPLVLSLLIFIGLIMLTTSIVLRKLESWQNHQQIMVALIQNDKSSIDKLHHADMETQRNILQYEGAKKSVVNLYITSRNNKDVIAQLETFDPSIQQLFFQDPEIQKRLLSHYQEKIAEEIKSDNFDNALKILNMLKNKLKNSEILFSDQYRELEQKRKQRLVILEQKYKECIEESQNPLVERIQCVIDILHKIEHTSGESNHLIHDPNLPTMYSVAIEQMLTNKDYQQAEKLLSEWQTILPESHEQREKLRETLEQHRQLEYVVSDLSSTDGTKIVNRLNQLITMDKMLQEEILQAPKVQQGLLTYHLNEILTLLQTKNNEEIEAYLQNHPHLQSLEKLLDKIKEKSTQSPLASPQQAPLATTPSPNTTLSTSPSSLVTQRVRELLLECQGHYQTNRLTTGPGRTALSCYREVLKIDANNSEAHTGLKNLERRYQSLAEGALKNGQFDKARNYLANLEKVNSRSLTLYKLRARLKEITFQPRKPILEGNESSKSQKEVFVPPKTVEQSKAVEQPKPVEQPKAVEKTYHRPEKPKVDPPVISKPLPPAVEKPKVVEKPKPIAPKISSTCKDCNCSELLRQLSIGVKPLTSEQQTFFQNQCR